ncbi:unnamed protein product [Allacma fusca]|uniref:SNTX MACPF/CDC-like domain-containing protein n=1 Tax=Allacma fusca TaxID=39272 RepID=A0A8J2NH65_9HEXA|nr:unnamed protein product [Allacma fusca]
MSYIQVERRPKSLSLDRDFVEKLRRNQQKYFPNCKHNAQLKIFPRNLAGSFVEYETTEKKMLMAKVCDDWDGRRLKAAERLDVCIDAERNRQLLLLNEKLASLTNGLQKCSRRLHSRRRRQRGNFKDIDNEIKILQDQITRIKTKIENLAGVFLVVSANVQEYLHIHALNRAADIGHLYDQVSDTFFLVKGIKGDFPSNFTEFVNNPLTDYNFMRVRSFSDKLDSFNLDVSAQASLLFGTVEVGGMFNYLTETSLETDYSYAILTYRTTVTTELLTLYRFNVLENIDTNIGRILGATHFIIGVEWGTDSLFSMKWKSANNSSLGSSSGSVNVAFSSPKFAGEIESSYQSLKKALAKTSDLEVSVYGNLALGKRSLKYIEDIEDYMSKVPELAKSLNGGKGTPVKFIAISLDKLDKLKNTGKYFNKKAMADEIGNSTSVEEVTMYILHSKMKNEYQEQQDILRKLQQYHSKATSFEDIFPTDYADHLKIKIERFQQVCKIFTIEMKYLLKSSRSSTTDVMQKYDSIQQKYFENTNGPSILTEINQDIAKYNEKIGTVMWLSKFGIHILKKTEVFEAVRIENQRKWDVHVFVTTTQSKLLMESLLYDRLEAFVHANGFKVYVDCDLTEVYDSSCKGFIRRLSHGAVLHKYNQYRY